MAKNNRKNRIPEDDDGRRIADMSALQPRSLFGARLPDDGAPVNTDPMEKPTKEERRAYLKGVITAVLLITGVFIVVLGLVIFGLQTYWNCVSTVSSTIA